MVTPPSDAPRKREIDPKTLARMGSLSLRARVLAESALHGMHRSRHHGSSVEFAEHKEYAAGDNVRHLDWRAYARLDRDYIKRFEDEAHLRALVLVDNSGSMGYRREEEGALSKIDYAVTCAGALSYLLARQGDAVGLATFDRDLQLRVPPRARRGHLQEIFANLESLAPSGSTTLAPALDKLAEGMRRRMVLLIFTDLLDAGDGALEAIGRVAARRHDVVLFHLMDPDELDFPFEESTLFTSLEDDQEVPVDARTVRHAYLQELGSFLDRVALEARAARVEYELIRTDTSPSAVLSRFINLRSSLRASAR